MDRERGMTCNKSPLLAVWIGWCCDIVLCVLISGLLECPKANFFNSVHQKDYLMYYFLCVIMILQKQSCWSSFHSTNQIFTGVVYSFIVPVTVVTRFWAYRKYVDWRGFNKDQHSLRRNETWCYSFWYSQLGLTSWSESGFALTNKAHTK